jgi:AcrR family transcriptional regulator
MGRRNVPGSEESMSADTEGPAGPGRPRSELAHRAILDATLERLSEVGYDRLTVASVASLAGVAKATIYRRWPSKLPLVIEAFSVLPTLASPDTGSVVDDLEEILRSFAEILTTTPLASVLPILAGECAHDPELSELLAPPSSGCSSARSRAASFHPTSTSRPPPT